MGQTLTHGVYLPDEGERNCYSGLAGNWQLLDGAVGTIAEHTSALSGKAPLVHTHTKSDITDFPAYGNTAGTICEGNDSRLSDARTPVAHTHTKSDVTDLLNSDFIPSANNSYNLGSSSYQWNNLYAKSYYYNGVAWGLDKANVWTQGNQFNGYVYSKAQTRAFKLGGFSNDEYTVQPQNTFSSEIDFVDKNDTTQSYIIFQHRADATETHRMCFRVNRTQGDHYVSVNLNNKDELYPERSNEIDLGTATKKWKSFNGVNPGALSLPDGRTSVAITIDITDWYVQDPNYPDDPTKKILDATEQTLSSNIYGWVEIAFTNAVGNYAYARRWQTGTNMATQKMADGNSDFNNVSLIFPIDTGGLKVRIKAKSATVKIYPCQGNV